MATFVLSLFWSLWHILIFFYRIEFGLGQVTGFLVGLFAGAILLTFLYNSTKGSTPTESGPNFGGQVIPLFVEKHRPFRFRK